MQFPTVATFSRRYPRACLRHSRPSKTCPAVRLQIAGVVNHLRGASQGYALTAEVLNASFGGQHIINAHLERWTAPLLNLIGGLPFEAVCSTFP